MLYDNNFFFFTEVPTRSQQWQIQIARHSLGADAEDSEVSFVARQIGGGNPAELGRRFAPIGKGQRSYGRRGSIYKRGEAGFRHSRHYKGHTSVDSRLGCSRGCPIERFWAAAQGRRAQGIIDSNIGKKAEETVSGVHNELEFDRLAGRKMLE